MAKTRSQVKVQKDDRAEILALTKIEDDWLEDRKRGETASTMELLDELYEGGSSDGISQTKSDFIKTITSSSSVDLEMEHGDRAIRTFGDLAISSGVVKISAHNHLRSFRYLRVYRKQDHSWRLIASQSARHLSN